MFELPFTQASPWWAILKLCFKEIEPSQSVALLLGSWDINNISELNGDLNLGVMPGENGQTHRGFSETCIKFLLMILANSWDANDLGRPLGVLAYNRHWKAGKQSWDLRDRIRIVDRLWKILRAFSWDWSKAMH